MQQPKASSIHLRILIAFFTVLFAPQLAFSFPLTPDPVMTTGELCSEEDPDFDHYRYAEQIPYCKRKVSYTRRQKIYDDYEIPTQCRHLYTIDHLIPLALGGNNSDQNLWPEHVGIKRTRVRLETQLYHAMRRGEMTQDEAVLLILEEKNGLKQNPISRPNPIDMCGSRKVMM